MPLFCETWNASPLPAVSPLGFGKVAMATWAIGRVTPLENTAVTMPCGNVSGSARHPTTPLKTSGASMRSASNSARPCRMR